eukprot:4482791-Prymnesium_polylepis.1
MMRCRARAGGCLQGCARCELRVRPHNNFPARRPWRAGRHNAGARSAARAGIVDAAAAPREDGGMTARA